jgi:hypothetical protein
MPVRRSGRKDFAFVGAHLRVRPKGGRCAGLPLDRQPLGWQFSSRVKPARTTEALHRQRGFDLHRMAGVLGKQIRYELKPKEVEDCK